MTGELARFEGWFVVALHHIFLGDARTADITKL